MIREMSAFVRIKIFVFLVMMQSGIGIEGLHAAHWTTCERRTLGKLQDMFAQGE